MLSAFGQDALGGHLLLEAVGRQLHGGQAAGFIGSVAGLEVGAQVAAQVALEGLHKLRAFRAEVFRRVRLVRHQQGTQGRDAAESINRFLSGN